MVNAVYGSQPLGLLVPTDKQVVQVRILSWLQKNKIMKKYHLTILRNGKYQTIFFETSSVTSFLMVEKRLGNETHILYSRELSDDEWKLV